MFEGMKVVSKGDIAVGLVCAAVIGGAATSIVLEQLGRSSARVAMPAPLSAPQIIRRNPLETVARFPTQINGRQVVCTVTVDHKRNAWSMSC